MGRAEGGASRAGDRREACRTPAKWRRRHPRRPGGLRAGNFQTIDLLRWLSSGVWERSGITRRLFRSPTRWTLLGDVSSDDVYRN